MKICDINPHIRYARMKDFSLIDAVACSYDSRLFFILDGECQVTVNDNDYNVKKNTLLLWQPGTRYMFHASKLNMISINFDFSQKANTITESIPPTIAHKFKNNLITDYAIFEDCEQFNQPLILENMYNVKKHLISVTEKFQKVRFYKNALASAILKRALTEIASSSIYQSVKTLNKLDIVLEYLRDNYNTDISNEYLGGLTGYHANHLNRLMLQYTGLTLHQQLINIRINAAKEMLIQTDYSIHEIALNCGFNDVSYFSNLFMHKTGMRPSIYRANSKNIL